MPVTLNSTGITFSNGQTLATSSPVGTITGLQYTAYQTASVGGANAWPTSDTFTTGIVVSFYPGYAYNVSTQIIVGSTYYRTTIINNSPGYPADSGNGTPTGSYPDGAVAFWRTVYRTVNGV
jgi:hypothetical protein